MNKQKAEKFIRRYDLGEATADEHELFLKELYDADAEDVNWLAATWMEFRLQQPDASEATDDNIVKRFKAAFEDHLSQEPASKTAKLHFFSKKWIAVAAMVLVVAVAATYFITREQLLRTDHEKLVTQKGGTVQQDYQHLADKTAILTLANGEWIVLDSLANLSAIAMEGNVKLTKVADDLLVYESLSVENTTNSNNQLSEGSHLISIPAGRNYQVQLPDGSKVWLNAVSTMKYALNMTHQPRVVELSGEAYFEVNKQHQPFKVLTINQSIEALGTSFNVNAYQDAGSSETTLLDGSVRVTSGQNLSAILEPGQQISVSKDTAVAAITRNVDAAGVIAWKSGLFAFGGKSTKEVLIEIARWNNVQLDWNDSTASGRPELEGAIPRSVDIETTLNILNGMGLKCVLENGVIKVE